MTTATNRYTKGNCQRATARVAPTMYGRTLAVAHNRKMKNWKPVKDFEHLYLVSDSGDVWSIAKKRNIYQYTDGDGYKKVQLYKNSQYKMFRVHRLVALAFLQTPDNFNDYEVNHRDKNRNNNCVKNLEWVSKFKNLELRYSAPADDVNIIDDNTNKIIAMCYNIAEASGITGLMPNIISKHIETQEPINGYRFEKGF
jgi:hypothetical protein